MQRFVIGMLVINHSGVLTRISGMFARRGFNIDSLTVGVTENPELSRMTVTMTGTEYERDQMLKQLGKLFEVKEIKEINAAAAVTRELAIIKVKASPESRLELLTVANTFGAKVVDFSAESICVEKTGESNKLDAFIELLKPYGIVEMCRTGLVAIDRGSTTLKK